ncbi:lymphoid-specific helicase-like [Onthophagus taurus]|uniref:lymphoid-specific helicase-like n=1 Tax=Onthophagus taurus TaxID=166361 RepID=UPI0039BDC550
MDNEPSTSTASGLSPRDVTSVDAKTKEKDSKKEKALEGIKQVLNMSETYSKFYNDKLTTSREGKKLKNMLNQPVTQESISDKNKDLKYFTGTLRDYQIDGVHWLKTLYQNGVNGILADEMGLGKTIQVIALLAHLYEKRSSGPFLIIVPLSTLGNWQNEFKKFAPSLPVVEFYGDIEERKKLQRSLFKTFTLKGDNVPVKPIVITTRHMVSKQLALFASIKFKCLIVDEAHMLKNYKSKVSCELRTLQCSNKLLLTGTPLQNNLDELWSILNFIMPMIFKRIDMFSSFLLLEDLQDNDKIIKEEESTNIVSKIHRMLAPFILRRLKSEVLDDIVPKKEVLVYCPLSQTQKNLYSYALEKNLNALAGKTIEEEEVIDVDQPRKKRKCRNENIDYTLDYIKKDDCPIVNVNTSEKRFFTVDGQPYLTKLASVLNPVMLFKKLANHPHLIQFPITEDLKERLVDQRLITESGKMMVLDALLKKLHKTNHKVLIFSTFTSMLDLLEDYMGLAGYNFRRLDGSDRLDVRGISVDDFNNDSDVFIFLISTRAGGLGLNLTGADTVIFFDRDWNPQMDLQAQDRCHRIGQTKPVMVYSLITKNTIDEKIVSLGHVKRRLEKIVIKDGKFSNANTSNYRIDLHELKSMLLQDNSEVVVNNENVLSETELKNLLDRSELYAMMDKKKVDNDNGVKRRRDNKENEITN